MDKLTIIQGMAVLLIRLLFIFISFFILNKINWQRLFLKENTYVIPYFVLLISISVGHLAGSFIITIIELLQTMLLSSLL